MPNGTDPFGLICTTKCCCCASDVRIKGNPVEQKSNEGVAGIGAKFVIEFETNWVDMIIDTNKSDEDNDCKMIWRERSTKGLRFPKPIRDQMIEDAKKIFGEDIKIRPQNPRQWYDQYPTEYWFLKMFKPWRDERKKPCPETEVTPIEDTPGVWGAPGKQIVQFELILKNSPNCKCAGPDKKLCFEFFAQTRKNGRFTWKLTPVECTPTKLPEFKY